MLSPGDTFEFEGAMWRVSEVGAKSLACPVNPRDSALRARLEVGVILPDQPGVVEPFFWPYFRLGLAPVTAAVM
jgi:hypothetical protein